MSENRKVTVPIGGAADAPADVDIAGDDRIPTAAARRRSTEPGETPAMSWGSTSLSHQGWGLPQAHGGADDSPVPPVSEHSVVVVGAGPTGMLLGAELTLAAVDVVIVERRETAELDGSRAGGLHARTLEVLDQRGVVERFLAAGQRHPRA